MSAFTENALVKKLMELNASQQSIQTVSLWLIHHRKHYVNIVKTWYKELLRGMQTAPYVLIAYGCFVWLELISMINVNNLNIFQRRQVRS